MLDGKETYQCWMGRRPTSAGWGGDLPVLDGEETYQCWMGRRPTSAEWGGGPPFEVVLITVTILLHT